jgi:hypothetical protein
MRVAPGSSRSGPQERSRALMISAKCFVLAGQREVGTLGAQTSYASTARTAATSTDFPATRKHNTSRAAAAAAFEDRTETGNYPNRES